ncbi:MAG: zinc ribbon domain-containing protein [Gemmatimonadetes bacterium]|uniref:Zinc ribbon domain-containing protein n=1 Tax=Candidatus Kutchimonas denitrificans TaxID=3056748 RepID=A0AAE4ZC48_9BACT|nr:zinc ribbon domain-containing protein [Gemmatimonadota bacterium]NIR75686.1 zinc ribbon domain-containing protein [Candidatus Kutchimonas denitrificans]NIS00299.1 zinc ribbon domain-containing protein [Gemmatimonadota bacterium]NIT65958.1 zinc ribbon domain-containing protein [Gemmatimonadota bacterium]NIU53662.1 zinc ribbon domain-containing protein [Gemmatimonadota bacterium]
MPTYDYRCESCGHQFEKFSQRISDESTAECPKCGGTAERLISGGAGLLFKGSGFYITDYRSDSYKKAEKQESGSGDGESSSSGEKSKSQSEKKAEPKKKDSS